MNIGRARDLSAERRAVEKRSSRFGQGAPRQIDMDFVRKYEKSAPSHAFEYETLPERDKSFPGVLRAMCRLKIAQR